MTTITAPATLTIPVGGPRVPSSVYKVRTTEQRAAVMEIVDSPDFGFACDNPLSAGVRPAYTGPFSFLWYDKSGELNAVRIGKRGNILQRATGSSACARFA
ncbi:hypothetical protein ACFOWE_18155 [Planomonospora corallina]|uniref:Uncharacterized protein n=1 Tax=Planomonospora corallina TaxID=1806052 RepID=A0ABV8I7V4_9ACTN